MDGGVAVTEQCPHPSRRILRVAAHETWPWPNPATTGILPDGWSWEDVAAWLDQGAPLGPRAVVRWSCARCGEAGETVRSGDGALAWAEQAKRFLYAGRPATVRHSDSRR